MACDQKRNNGTTRPTKLCRPNLLKQWTCNSNSLHCSRPFVGPDRWLYFLFNKLCRSFRNFKCGYGSGAKTKKKSNGEIQAKRVNKMKDELSRPIFIFHRRRCARLANINSNNGPIVNNEKFEKDSKNQMHIIRLDNRQTAKTTTSTK